MAEPLTESGRLESLIEYGIERFDAGYARGWHDALQDRQSNARQAEAAAIALDHLQVHQARQKAAGRWAA